MATRWLLKMLRLYAHEPGLRTLRSLAEALRCATVPRVSDATVSRWEQTVTPAPREALVRYEQLFDLGHGQLVAVVSSMRESPRTNRSRRDDAVLQARGDDLLERALNDELLNGADWVDLADFLIASASGPVWLRARDWSDIIMRLLTEMSVSCGWRYLQRLGALHRFHHHPKGRRLLVTCVVDFVSDLACPIVIDPIAVLADSLERSTETVLLRMLRAPLSEPMLQAALTALAARATRQAYDAVTVKRIAATAAEHLTEISDPRPVRYAAADLLAVFSRTHLMSVDRLRGHPAIDEQLRAALSFRATIAQVTAPPQLTDLLSTLSRAADGRHDDDAVVTRLVRDAMFSTHTDSKIYAANFLHASPFQQCVATAAAKLLGQAARGRTSHTDVALADLVGSIGGAEHRPALEAALTTHDSDVAVAAAIGLAHLPGHTSLATWKRVLHGQNNGEAPLSAVLRDAVLYAVGMNHDAPAIRLFASNHDLPAEIRRRARWWLTLPTAQVISARV